VFRVDSVSVIEVNIGEAESASAWQHRPDDRSRLPPGISVHYCTGRLGCVSKCFYAFENAVAAAAIALGLEWKKTQHQDKIKSPSCWWRTKLLRSCRGSRQNAQEA